MAFGNEYDASDFDVTRAAEETDRIGAYSRSGQSSPAMMVVAALVIFALVVGGVFLVRKTTSSSPSYPPSNQLRASVEERQKVDERRAKRKQRLNQFLSKKAKEQSVEDAYNTSKEIVKYLQEGNVAELKKLAVLAPEMFAAVENDPRAIERMKKVKCADLLPKQFKNYSPLTGEMGLGFSKVRAVKVTCKLAEPIDYLKDFMITLIPTDKGWSIANLGLFGVAEIGYYPNMPKPTLTLKSDEGEKVVPLPKNTWQQVLIEQVVPLLLMPGKYQVQLDYGTKVLTQPKKQAISIGAASDSGKYVFTDVYATDEFEKAFGDQLKKEFAQCENTITPPKICPLPDRFDLVKEPINYGYYQFKARGVTIAFDRGDIVVTMPAAMGDESPEGNPDDGVVFIVKDFELTEDGVSFQLSEESPFPKQSKEDDD
ncbi:hypothetical protein BK816_07980 [Boudabousia tangfeifanii]|uniref:Uncharacterized protein n=1 Tax=Boudabousia tangfeifanii TaxID=1912795 RepID=A0A1D9MLI2_9ACTO|nr:hypothetical protein [Boudabousia tangfeifanii]AOZ73231.1 hypothetical protein BK816_07980 [Boudabousia tangfeifanii]